jgi:hypothetical protein
MTQSRQGFKKPAPLPLPVAYDEQYTDWAFDTYKREHGFGDSIRLGDMPHQVLREVLQAAQRLKERANSQRA